jgi:hypothetical protein
VTDKDSVCLEEDAILSDYLSYCKLVKRDDNVTLCLPDEKDHEIPEGFGCIFHREAEERIFSTTGDEEECFTVIVLDEKGWDSDGVDKREQKQVCCFNFQKHRQKRIICWRHYHCYY